MPTPARFRLLLQLAFALFLLVGVWACRGLAQEGLDRWTWRNPLPQGNALRAVGWSGTQFVAVGDGGAILGSTDGRVWTQRQAGTLSHLTAITWGAGQFVAVGRANPLHDLLGSSPVLTSLDGVNWTVGSAGGWGELLAITWDGYQFVAVGADGVVLTSTDAVNWSRRETGITADLRAIAWSGRVFVAVGEGATILSSTDGRQWTRRSVEMAPKDLNAVIWDGHQFVAAGESPVILTSDDGVIWVSTTGSTNTANPVNGLAWNGSRHVAAAGNFQGLFTGSGRLLTSADGLNWTVTIGDPGPPLTAVLWASDKFVAVGGGGAILTSSDGLSWVSCTQGTISNFTSIASGPGRFVAVGESGSILTSVDGGEWIPCPSGISHNLCGVAWGGNGFVAVGEGGTILTSPTGTDWTIQPSGVTDTLRRVVAGAGRFVAVGDGGTILSSADGSRWTRALDPSARRFTGVAWSGKLFLAVSDYRLVATSPDGIEWTSQWSNEEASMADVIWQTDRFIAVTTLGRVRSTADGVSWTAVSGSPIKSSSGESVAALTVTGSQLVAVGSGGTVSSSFDGVTWVVRPAGVANSLKGVACNGARYVAVGSDGAILSADIVDASPRLLSQPGHQSAAAGGTATFAATATGTGILRYQWQRNGTDLFGATEPTLTVTNVNVADAGWYRVRVIDGAGEVWSDAAALRVTLTATPATEPTAYALLPGDAQKALVWDGNRFLGVGSRTLFTSPDGRAWSRFDLRDNGIEDLVWTGQQYIGVGAFAPFRLTGGSGVILTSADGVTWTSQAVEGISHRLSKIAWNGSRFVAVGIGETVTSLDGVNWTSVQVAGSSVAGNADRFVMVGESGQIRTSEDGTTWTARTSGASVYLWDVAWGGGTFVVVGNQGTVLTSRDGIAWTPRSAGTAEYFAAVEWTGACFVATDQAGGIYTSADGVAWSGGASASRHTLWEVAANGSAVVVQGGGSTLTSLAGTTWTNQGAATLSTLRAVTRRGSRWVAVSIGGTIVTSVDRRNWTAPILSSETRLIGVAAGENGLVAMGATGAVLTSPDGVTWTARAAVDGHLNAVTWTGREFFAMSDAGVYLTSADGVSWTRGSVGESVPLVGVAWSGERYVVVSGADRVFTSADGIAWSGQPIQPSNLTGVAWGGGQFVAVGGGGSILTSPDGTTWTAQTPGVGPLRSVASTGSGFVAVGDAGVVLTSPDGVVWTQRLPGVTTNVLWGVTWSGDRMMAVGDLGTILTSHFPAATVQIVAQPQSLTVNAGNNVVFSVTATGSNTPTYQWRFNGVPIAGATAATLALESVQLAHVGSYDVLISDPAGTTASAVATLGITSDVKVSGAGREVDAGIRHPNGNVFDQVLVTGAAETITADWTANEITRTSFIDLDDDIVQVEFSGPGTLSLVLEGSSGPARPVNYAQPVDYVKGHAAIIITGADERTNVSVFTVGRATAFDPTGAYNILKSPSATNDPAKNGSPLFIGHAATNYDGIADIAYIAISSTNGKFGGVHTANAHYFASKGITGIHAPGVAFQSPVYVGDITAFETAVPELITGSVSDVRIAGGDLLQENGRAVQVGALAALVFTEGMTSNGPILPAATNQARLERDGVDVTDQVAPVQSP